MSDNISIVGNLVGAGAGHSIFNPAYIWLILGVLVIMYVYTWLHDTEMATRITYAIFSIFIAIGKVLIKAIMAIFSMISRLIWRRRR